MFRLAVASIGLALFVMAGPVVGQAPKDQSRVAADNSAAGGAGPGAVPQPAPDQTTPTGPDAQSPGSDSGGEDLTQQPPDSSPDATDDGGTPDELSLGEIPTIKTVELTIDAAKRALDVFALVKDKYKDANLEDYEDLQDFVDKNAQGKAFEADVKAAWFSTVDEWNSVITSVGFAYSAITDDQSSDINQQIEEIKKDTTIAQDMKDKMITSLQAMISSDNNRKVVTELMSEPAYADKLALLVEDE